MWRSLLYRANPSIYHWFSSVQNPWCWWTLRNNYFATDFFKSHDGSASPWWRCHCFRPVGLRWGWTVKDGWTLERDVGWDTNRGVCRTKWERCQKWTVQQRPFALRMRETGPDLEKDSETLLLLRVDDCEGSLMLRDAQTYPGCCVQTIKTPGPTQNTLNQKHKQNQ